MNHRIVVVLVMLCLGLAGCLGGASDALSEEADPAGGDQATDPNATPSPNGEADIDTSALDELPYHASWTGEDFEGTIAFRVTVDPSETTACGFNVVGSGTTAEEDALLGLALDSWNANEVAVLTDGRQVLVDGTGASDDGLPISWGFRSGTDNVTSEPFSVFFVGISLDDSRQGSPPVEIGVGCRAPFETFVEAGSEEVIPFSEDCNHQNTCVSSGPVGGVEPVSLARGTSTFQQEANRSLVYMADGLGEDTFEEGHLRVDTPTSNATRHLDGSRFDPIREEAGPGEYRITLERTAAASGSIYGVLAGLDPIGDVEDLARWAKNHSSAS
jgi:hypothetical protein